MEYVSAYYSTCGMVTLLPGITTRQFCLKKFTFEVFLVLISSRHNCHFRSIVTFQPNFENRCKLVIHLFEIPENWCAFQFYSLCVYLYAIMRVVLGILNFSPNIWLLALTFILEFYKPLFFALFPEIGEKPIHKHTKKGKREREEKRGRD